jgi:hypothetical protein
MPVIGGYLAFIGFFCLQAGVAVSTSTTMSSIVDWVNVMNPHSIVLAIPALLSGFALTWLSRNVNNDAVLPLAMVGIPSLFYISVALSGAGLQGARVFGWVGGEF